MYASNMTYYPAGGWIKSDESYVKLSKTVIFAQKLPS
jgi:hypothetical protein